MLYRHDCPKAEVAIRVVRQPAASVGDSTSPSIHLPPTPSINAPYTVIGAGRVLGVGHVVPILASPEPILAPLPHVPGHVETSVGRNPVGVESHLGCSADI